MPSWLQAVVTFLASAGGALVQRFSGPPKPREAPPPADRFDDTDKAVDEEIAKRRGDEAAKRGGAP